MCVNAGTAAPTAGVTVADSKAEKSAKSSSLLLLEVVVAAAGVVPKALEKSPNSWLLSATPDPCDAPVAGAPNRSRSSIKLLGGAAATGPAVCVGEFMSKLLSDFPKVAAAPKSIFFDLGCVATGLGGGAVVTPVLGTDVVRCTDVVDEGRVPVGVVVELELLLFS